MDMIGKIQICFEYINMIPHIKPEIGFKTKQKVFNICILRKIYLFRSQSQC